MAGIKIIALPPAPSAQLTDVFPVSQGGVTYKESNSQLLSLFESNIVITPSNFSGTLPVGNGGTGNTTFTPYSVICAGTTSTGAFQNVSGLGSSSQVLTSNGAGLLPTWQNATTVTPAALTKADDTNITLTLGGTPATALLQATSITAGWTGTLSGTRGGTGVNNGASTITLGGSLTTSGAFASTFTMTGPTSVTFPTSGTLSTTTGTVTSVSGTTNRITSTGGTTPVIDISASYVGQSSITTLGTIGTGVWNGSIISGTYGGTGVNNGASTITLGGSLTTSGAFASTFTMTGATNVTFPTSGTLSTTTGTVTSVSGTTNRITSTGGDTPVIDISASYVGQASITTLGTITSGTWNGTTIAVANGGTGITSFGTGVATWLGTPSSANLAAAVTDETGSGALVFGTSPTLTTPTLGVASATSINKVAITAPASSATLTIADGKTLTVSNTLTFTGTDSSSVAFGAGGTVLYAAGSGGLKSFQIFTSGTAATYTRPAGITSILVEVIGGGGGGGGSAGAVASAAAAGGGGSGGYARLYVASASSSYTYTVGPGGAAGTAGNNAGTGGTTTTFSASSLQATGGAGGAGAASVATPTTQTVLGGAGGVGSNGNVIAVGAPGGPGHLANTSGFGGYGGSSYLGGGANSIIAPGTGTAASNYGSGGGGAVSTTTGNAGGAGSAGLIIVWEFS